MAAKYAKGQKVAAPNFMFTGKIVDVTYSYLVERALTPSEDPNGTGGVIQVWMGESELKAAK